MHKGSCLCGAVTFEVAGELPGPDACHCSQCRRWSGHYWTSSDVQKSALTVHGAEQVRWFESSPHVRRGFCGTCGSVLFWDAVRTSTIGVSMGSFDAPTGTHVAEHIFLADKGDYYDVVDDVPKYAGAPTR